MAIKIGINGFGRIGRMVFRAAVQNFSDIEIVGINDLLEPDYLAYMLQYDSVHGRFQGAVSVKDGALVVNGKTIRLTQERDPANLQWGAVGADVVIEATGLFLDKASAENTWPQARKKCCSRPRAKTTHPCLCTASTTRPTLGKRLSRTRPAPPIAWPQWPWC